MKDYRQMKPTNRRQTATRPTEPPPLIEAPFTLRGELMPEPKAAPVPRYDPRQMKLFE